MRDIKQYNLNRLLAICYRCNYEWIPRVEDVRTCAKCRSPYWDKAKDPNDYWKMKMYAALLITKAKKAGLLGNALDQKCVDCGKQAKCWEHRNYARPLLVVPTCHRCNKLRGVAKNYDKIKFDKFKAKQIEEHRIRWNKEQKEREEYFLAKKHDKKATR